jgi:hypothetical protein
MCSHVIVRARFHRRVLRACVWFGKCALACVNVCAYARARVWLAPPTTSGTPVLVLLAQLGPLRRLRSPPSFSFALLASPTWRSRCRHHLRRSWPESLLPLASPALLAPLAPLEPLAQLACCGSVVRLRASHTPMVAQARVRARACLRLRACVCACVRCVRAGCPGAIGQAAGPGRPLWSWLPRAVAQVPAVQMPALAEPMWELLEHPILVLVFFLN